ncbi:MAG TPA: folate family ECF transporter S component, partial [Ruminococcus sp.]|nr:folate family ECF transporter S component [Ruminococcus sp.]
MTTNKNASSSAVASLRLFGNIRVLVISALFIAMSIALGKLLAFNVTPYIRISFENLTILMAGIFFGPFVGAAVGTGADIIGCILVGYSINPIITLGAASIGLVAGIVSSSVFKGNVKLNTAFSVGLAHLIGSVIIKSIGLRVYYNYPIG